MSEETELIQRSLDAIMKALGEMAESLSIMMRFQIAIMDKLRKLGGEKE